MISPSDINLGKPDLTHMKFGTRYHYLYGAFVDHVVEDDTYRPFLAEVPAVTMGECPTLAMAEDRIRNFLQNTLIIFQMRGDIPPKDRLISEVDLMTQFETQLHGYYKEHGLMTVRQVMTFLVSVLAQLKEGIKLGRPMKMLNDAQKERLVDDLFDTVQWDHDYLRGLLKAEAEGWNYDQYIDHFGGEDPLGGDEE